MLGTDAPSVTNAPTSGGRALFLILAVMRIRRFTAASLGVSAYNGHRSHRVEPGAGGTGGKTPCLQLCRPLQGASFGPQPCRSRS